MKNLFSCTAALVLFIVFGLPLRGANDALTNADLAWDRGDYVAALNGYLALLDSPQAHDVLEPIALTTGELFTTAEVTTDGANPKVSPDGRHLAYEVPGTTTVKVVALNAPTATAFDVPGTSPSFSLDGTRLVYLRVERSKDLDDARVALDQAPGGERAQRQIAFNTLLAATTQLTVRELASGRETTIDTGTLRKTTPMFAAKDAVLFSGGELNAPAQIYVVRAGGAPVAVTTGPQDKTLTAVNSTGTAALVGIRTPGGGRGGGGGGAAPASFGLLSIEDGRFATIAGSAPSFSGDGASLTYVAREGNESRIMVAPTTDTDKATAARKGTERIDAPALSRDGSRIVFQMMPKEDWEVFVVNRDGSGETRLTREIQHDIQPMFLSNDRVLAMIGEARHRRSYVYDVAAGKRTRVFHNNTVRTIAPEYFWIPTSDGSKLVIVAERDGDTVSLERGIYVVDLAKKITVDALRARLKANLAAEQALIAKGKRLYAPIASAVRDVVGQASVARVFGYEKALFDFDSKHITRPGNKLASEYLFNTYKSFGYQPEYQWFAGRGALGGQTANVIATLKGTVNPELVYVVSSHYDSVAIGPGADDDTSGTAALLEAARILARHPQPATIVFASFTGEEAGLLGSREYVRRAVESKTKIVGALNNDMIGWANDHRLDNTIRYSNPGIRDIQHAAAMQFTNLITYDALYYKSTDAAAYYEAYGDIVGGIGSYPVLGNPHYHQSHDLLDTINHQLVTEVAKTTAATLMLLASSPSRVTGLTVDNYANGTATLSWKPSPESGVTGYIVSWGPASNPEAQQMRVTKPSAAVKAAAGSVIAVKAINNKGFEGWDWARVRVGER